MANFRRNFASRYHFIYSQICIKNKTDKMAELKSAYFKMENNEN